jgi:hypothetical protein
MEVGASNGPTFSGHLCGNTGEIRQLLLDDSDGYKLSLRREGRTLIAYVAPGREYSRGEMFPAPDGFTCALVEPTLKNELRLTGVREGDGYTLRVDVWIHPQWRFPWETAA